MNKTTHDGNCNMPAKNLLEPKLGIWVTKQCKNYINDSLTMERKEQLEAIGFEWTMNVAELNMQDYQKYHNGDCDMPNRCPLDPKLGYWLDTQCSNYKK